MPFGLKMAPQLFQRINLKNFGNIPGVVVYIDDILIAGDTDEEHDLILKEVLGKAKFLNVKFNANKLQYKLKEVTYLGQIHSGGGNKIDNNRIKAIKNLNNPKKELQSVLGMVNFLRNFIPQIAEITSPLRDLIKKIYKFYNEKL